MKTLNNPKNNTHHTNKSDKHFYVAIVAPLGSGKTTLMKQLAKYFRPIYPTYTITNTDHLTFHKYKNETGDIIQRRILDGDAETIINAFKQTNNEIPALFIADSSYHEHYIYTLVKHKLGQYNAPKYEKLKFIHNTIRSTLPAPDMYIYIDVPRNTILNNIKDRHRDFEVEGSNTTLQKYVTNLKEKYHDLFLTNRNYRYNKAGIQNIHTYTYKEKEMIEISNYIQQQMYFIMSKQKVKVNGI